MREATGELNISLVVITLVSALVAFFYFVIWPNINRDQERQSNCSKAICDKKLLNSSGMVKCEFTDRKGNPATVWCKYKG